MRGSMPPFDGRANSARFGGFTANFQGAWGTTVPGPTSGAAMTLPAGVLRGLVNISGYNGGIGNVQVDVYLDGVYVGSCAMFANSASFHLVLAPLAFTATVTAGTHYIGFRQVAGVSDANDRASVIVTVSPA